MAEKFMPSLTGYSADYLESTTLADYLAMDQTIVRLLVQTHFPDDAPDNGPNWMSHLYERNPLLVPKALLACGYGNYMLNSVENAIQFENLIAWLGAKLDGQNGSPDAVFTDLGSRLQLQYGNKGTITYYQYLKSLVPSNVTKQSFYNFLIAQCSSNDWMDAFFTNYYRTYIFPLLMNGKDLTPFAAQAMVNCGNVTSLREYFNVQYRTITFANIPISKQLLYQMVYKNPDMRLAWLQYFIDGGNPLDETLAISFEKANMSLKELLNNVKAYYGTNIYNSLMNSLNQNHDFKRIVHVNLSEQPIYGSSRLGVKTYSRSDLYAEYEYDEKNQLSLITSVEFPLTQMQQNPVGNISNHMVAQPEYSLTLGYKQYELSNHLGNVQATISDKKLGLLQDESSTFAGYEADLLSAVDYYPFGMQMPERSVNSSTYRYGMNTQERDKEINENIYSALFWEYDARLGRRWNLDPKPQVNISDYSCFGNNPLIYIDPLGDDKYKLDKDGKIKLVKKTN
jgi:RHS repeat-associated protein